MPSPSTLLGRRRPHKTPRHTEDGFASPEVPLCMGARSLLGLHRVFWVRPWGCPRVPHNIVTQHQLRSFACAYSGVFAVVEVEGVVLDAATQPGCIGTSACGLGTTLAT